MATTQTIDATIFASSHPDIAKRTSISGVLFSSFMLLVGILAFASTFELEDRSSTVSMALMVFGTGLFLVGIDEAMSSFREVVGQVEIGDPGSGPFQLRSGGNRCQRHFRIRIDVRSVQAERELVHSVCRTA